MYSLTLPKKKKPTILSSRIVTAPLFLLLRRKAERGVVGSFNFDSAFLHRSNFRWRLVAALLQLPLLRLSELGDLHRGM